MGTEKLEFTMERTDKGLMVKDFDMGSYLLKDERSGLNRHIGPDYYRDALAIDKMRRAKGKKPGVFMNHTDKENSYTIGSIEEMRFRDNKLYGDLLIDDEEIAAKLEKGELVSSTTGRVERSLELSPDTPFIAGVALLDATEGHFSEELVSIPTSKYTNLEKDSDLGKITLVSLAVEVNEPQENKMTDKIDLILEKLEAMNDRLVKLEAAKPAVNDDQEEYDPFKEQEDIEAKIKLEAEKLSAKSALESKTELWVIRLERNGCKLTPTQIRKDLSKAKDLEELDYRGKILELRAAKAHGATVEPDPEDESPDNILKMEFEAGQAKGKWKTLTLEQFIELNKDTVK